MVSNLSDVEQAVLRALRDNLEKLQRTVEELHQAVADLVAACSSNRPSNALPPILRAQTASASLAAALDVLSRFITSALPQQKQTAVEEAAMRIVTGIAPEPAPMPTLPPPSIPVPMARHEPSTPHVAAPTLTETAQAEEMIAEGGPVPPAEAAIAPLSPPSEPAAMPLPRFRVRPPTESDESAVSRPIKPTPEPFPGEPFPFDLTRLSPAEQELHRRANRVAKVSMQDIKMLRPEQVRLGRQHRDICVRLKDDIEKAHKEYDRRFRAITDHPVDYFYSWMVEILGGGDPEALGEYPYPSAALRR